MIRCESKQLPYLRFATIDDSIAHHAVLTRLGGTSRPPFDSLNLGQTVGDDPDCVAANHARIYDALDIPPDCVVTAQQVHGNRIGIVTSQDGGSIVKSTDALVTNEPGVYLMLRFADCVPILIYSPDRGVVALVHAGWRGTAQRIASHAVQEMVSVFGCDPAAMRAGIAPSIGPCCYEVDSEVSDTMLSIAEHSADVVTRRDGQGKAYVDLWRANADQLAAQGVGHIEVARVCTRCHRDTFFSHRGDGGHTGRFAAIIGLRQPESNPQHPSRTSRIQGDPS